MQIRSKLTIGTAVVVLAALAVATSGFIFELASLSERQSRASMELALNVFVRSVRDATLSYDLATIDDAARVLAQQDDALYVAVYDAVGREIATYGDPAPLERVAIFADGVSVAAGESRVQGVAEIPGVAGRIGSVRLDLSTAALREARDAVILNAALQAVLVALAAAALAAAMTRKALGDLRKLESFARRVAAGDEAARAEVESDDEIGVLARCMNRMSEEIARERTALVVQAQTDGLTGVANRKGFTYAAERLVRDSRRRWFVLHLDLDGFKAINDSRGHEAGDAVLNVTAQRISLAVGDLGTMGRFGGDEFVTVCRAPTGQTIREFAEDLIREVSKAVAYGSDSLHVGASIGIAAVRTNESGNVIAAAIADADIALQRAKVEGKGRAAVFDHALRDVAEANARTVEEARRGLIAGEFRPYFQPQVDLGTGAVVGLECLMRWRRPGVGDVAPPDFLPALKDGELLERIDWAVRDAACAWLAKAIAAGVLGRDVTVGFNFPQNQLRDPDVPERLLDLVLQHGLDAANIGVELLETVMHDRGQDSIGDNIRRLVSHGFAIELDDFGTGYSSLEKLLSLSVDRIKIDRSFIEDPEGNPASRQILEAIIGIGRTLEMDVLVEGAETEEQIALLRRLGCPTVQGRYFSPPLPPEELWDWLAARQPDTRLSVPV